MSFPGQSPVLLKAGGLPASDAKLLAEHHVGIASPLSPRCCYLSLPTGAQKFTAVSSLIVCLPLGHRNHGSLQRHFLDGSKG